MLSSVPWFSILFGTHLCCPSVSGFKIKRQQQKKTRPNHFKYLAPCFHLPPEGAHLHQAGHRGGRFDGRAAVLLWHGALGAVDELDAGDGPLSHAQVAGRRARPSPHDLPPGSTTAIVLYLSFYFLFFSTILSVVANQPGLDCATWPGSCDGCRRPQLRVWGGGCTRSPPPPPPPPPPPLLPEHSTAPCWSRLLRTLHCTLLAWSATCVSEIVSNSE